MLRGVRQLSVKVSRYDFKGLVSNLDRAILNSKQRKCDGDASKVAQLYDRYCSLKQELEEGLHRRKELARLIPMQRDDEDAQRKLVQESQALKAEIAKKTLLFNGCAEDLEDAASRIPNDTSPLTPVGAEANARVIKSWGDAATMPGRPSYSKLLQAFDWANFAGAANSTGEGFVFLKKDLALLEIALVQLALSEAQSHGFEVVTTPDLVKESVLHGCGFRARSDKENQTYKIEGEPFALIATSEMAIAGMHAGEIMSGLPKKYCGYSHCFRKEASHTAGAGTLYRMHQFSKVELFCFSTPANSELILMEMVDFQTRLLERLGLPYRALEMPTEELGLAAHRKIDCEIFIPSLQRFGEVSSASNCTDFQSRRLDIRYRVETGNNPFVHTINATALAVPRILIGLLEHHYEASKNQVVLPDILHPYMGASCIPRAQ